MIVLGASRRSLLSFSSPKLLSQNFRRNSQNLQGTMNSTPGSSEVGSINRASVSPKMGHLFVELFSDCCRILSISLFPLFQGKRVNYMVYLYHDPCVVFSMAFFSRRRNLVLFTVTNASKLQSHSCDSAHISSES